MWQKHSTKNTQMLAQSADRAPVLVQKSDYEDRSKGLKVELQVEFLSPGDN